jgi:hypothetical protein
MKILGNKLKCHILPERYMKFGMKLAEKIIKYIFEK